MGLFDKLGLTYYSPGGHKNGKFGYKPSVAIKYTRKLAKGLISLFGLNKNSRFIVELQQQIDPVMDVDIGDGDKIRFCTGHGRLVWRAKTLLTEEPDIIKWIMDFDDKDVFFDIGANVGLYSIFAAKKKNIKVFSFEPEINNVQLLYSNIYKNGLTSICTPLPLACDKDTAMKPFYIREFSKGGAINCIDRKSVFLDDDSNCFIQNTLCMRLDDAIREFNLPLPTKVKIDVDTNELQVLLGMKETLKSVQSVYIELFEDFEEHREAMQILREYGFEITVKTIANAPKRFESAANYIFTRKKD